jgi:hypothetical protein
MGYDRLAQKMGTDFAVIPVKMHYDFDRRATIRLTACLDRMAVLESFFKTHIGPSSTDGIITGLTLKAFLRPAKNTSSSFARAAHSSESRQMMSLLILCKLKLCKLILCQLQTYRKTANQRPFQASPL